uniref:Uncharacterized protein n=1 Tax=Anopheles maculatus TaxID=74869 RepID=A0A182SAL6_9DIPT
TDKTSSSTSGGNSTVPSLTVRNLAKLQQQKSSSGELLGNGMLHQQSHAAGLSNLSEQYRKSSNQSSNPATSTPTTTTTNASVGRDTNAAPVDDALWYWLKSQQAMLGLNNLYTALPRATSHSPPTPPPPMGLNSVTVGAGSPNHGQTTLPSSAHTPHTPPPPLVGPPLVSTPQPTPPSSAPSLTPEDTKNSSWFWQWYKTFGASLMPGGTAGGAGTTAADSKQHLREQQQQQAAQQAAIAAALHHHNNNNSLSQQNQNNSAAGQKGNGGAAATAASLTAAYENILYSQLTKGSSANAVDTLNNNHHHHLNHHLSAHLKNEPMDLNMSGANDGDSKPEDLSNHHAVSGKDRNSAMGNGGDERRSRYHHNSPSRPSSASSVASSSMSAHGSRDGAEHLMPPTLARASEDREDDEVAALDAEEHKLNSSTTVVEATSTDAADVSDLKEDDGEEEDGQDRNESGQQRVLEDDDAGAPVDQVQMPEKERKHRSGALKRRRCSSAELVEAKEALDNILFSGNSNDRCSTVSSVAASPPPPLLSMVVRGESTSPVGTTIGEHNGGDGLLHLDGKGDTTGDECKSETSEDSNHRQSTLTPVTSVAVADIRNSAEAVEHGEKFLKWLEACSDPNVTAMQVMQFKYLLNSIKLSAERQLQTATAGSAFAGNGPEERTRIRKRK